MGNESEHVSRLANAGLGDHTEGWVSVGRLESRRSRWSALWWVRRCSRPWATDVPAPPAVLCPATSADGALNLPYLSGSVAAALTHPPDAATWGDAGSRSPACSSLQRELGYGFRGSFWAVAVPKPCCARRVPRACGSAPSTVAAMGLPPLPNRHRLSSPSRAASLDAIRAAVALGASSPVYKAARHFRFCTLAAGAWVWDTVAS